jgi:hypothetical protein
MHLKMLRRHRWLAALFGLLAVGVVTVAILGCCITGADAVAGRSVASSPPTTSAPPNTARSTTATPPVDPSAVLVDARAAAAAAEGSIRVVVLDADGRPLITGPDAGAPTYTASLVKVLVVARLLALDAAGSLALSGEDLDLIQRAVVQSDDGAMSRLWDRYDGAELVRHVATTVGLTGTHPPSVPGQWGQTVTTAADVATVLSALGDILDDVDVEALLGWMRSTSAIAADGFDQWFGLLAEVRGMAAKQGWMCCVDGVRQLHSAGVLSDGRVVVLLGEFPASTSWDSAVRALDDAGAAVLAELADGT